MHIKLKTSPARFAQLLQPSSAFCFSLQPMFSRMSRAVYYRASGSPAKQKLLNVGLFLGRRLADARICPISFYHLSAQLSYYHMHLIASNLSSANLFSGRRFTGRRPYNQTLYFLISINQYCYARQHQQVVEVDI